MPVLVLLTAWLVGTAPAMADDRELLRERGADPYVFIIFDTSGSMYWSSVCSAEDACEDIDPWDGACTSVCPFDDEVCPSVCPDWGCIEYGTTDLEPTIDIEADDTVAGAGDIEGGWSQEAFPDALGGVAYTTSNDGASIRLRQTVTDTRRYKLLLHVPRSLQWATEVPVEVSGVVEPASTVIDQRGAAALVDDPDDYDPWRLVGVYEATAGSQVTVRVRTSGANGPVVVDGLRLVSEVKECLEEGYRCQQALCPTGDCFVPLNADGPQSKMFQARASLHEVLGSVTNVRFGFATYEQDNLKVRGKHWLYRVREREPDANPDDGVLPPVQSMLTLLEGTRFPQPGDEEVFGLGDNEGWECDTGGGDNNIGCYRTWPADLGDAWERERVRRLPKLGRLRSQGTTVYVRENQRDDRVYRVEYAPVSGYDLDDEILATRVRAWRCLSDSCPTWSSLLVDDETIYLDRVSDFIAWDNGVRRGAERRGYFNQSNAGDASAVNTCGHDRNGVRSGWDPNDDSTGLGSQDDIYSNVNLRWPTVADSRSTSANQRVFDVGDVVPWDWQDGADRVQEIQQRLAPNTVSAPDDPPDFRTARYFNNDVLSTDSPDSNGARRLRLASDAERPLVPDGSTPIGYAMANFQRWFQAFSTEATQVGANGATIDPDWSCRDKFVLFLTDGDDTCSFDNSGNLISGAVNPSSVAKTLFETNNVKTYVVGFGLSDDGDDQLTCSKADDQLACMAVEGGTEEPIYPKNQDELVSALLDIFGEVQAESRAFASASLPAQQSTAADKIFFSSFTPLPQSAYWSGRVDVFREPLLDVAEPPICRSCVREGLEAGCHLYNIGDTILAQAPTDDEIDAAPPEGNMGPDLDQRRVLYPPATVPEYADGRSAQPQALRLFTMPDLRGTLTLDEQAVRDDLEAVFLDSAQQSGTASQKATRLESVYRQTLRVKNSAALADALPCSQTPVGAPIDYEPGDYLLGDVFHANPLITTGPNDLTFFRANLCGEVEPGPLAPPDNCPSFGVGDDDLAFARGYRNLVRRNRWFRRMLTVASNDGQLHFFDAGVRREIDGTELFTDGSGVELFSYMPRMVMPVVREQAATGASQIFSVDGSFTFGEVMIDPLFTSQPDPGDREWRTVVVGGLREGGRRFDDIRDVDGFTSGYYALDVSQPDGLTVIENDSLDPTDDEYVPDGAVANGRLPSCLEVDGDGNVVASPRAGCRSVTGAQLPFPALKWEFTDRVYYFDTDGDAVDTSGWYALDEDRNGQHDLAQTWSKPLIEQVRILDGGLETTRWVAIFGGGIDPTLDASTARGNFVYMIDIETGVALYKRAVEGAVASDMTGLDPDDDGLLDVLYFTTTAGLLYKVDLGEAGELGIETLRAEDVSTPADGVLEGILGWPDTAVAVETERVISPEWEPFAIFDTGGRPLYHAPAVVSVGSTDRFALAFGSGDREDLWDFQDQTGRFYVVVDERFERPVGTTDLPLTEADFVNIDFDAPLVGVDADGLPVLDAPDYVSRVNDLPDGTTAARGWVMRFPIEARVSSRAFVLSGVLVFTVFQPQVDPELGGDQALCRRTGLSRTFVVDVRNGDALTTLKNLRDPNLDDDRGLLGGSGAPPGNAGGTEPSVVGDCGDRCSERVGFGTAPFVSSGATKNPTTVGALGAANLDPLADPVMRRLMANLKRSFFAPGCQFNDSFYEMIRMQFDDTGVKNLVPVPVGICPSDTSFGHATWSTDAE